MPAWSSTSLDAPSSASNNSNSNNSRGTATTPHIPRRNSFHRPTPQQQQQQQHTTTLPINLSLSEDERSPNRSNTDSVSPRFPKASHILAKGSGDSNLFGGSQVAEDDEEQLYEYFPLTVDDWYVHFYFPFFFPLSCSPPLPPLLYHYTPPAFLGLLPSHQPLSLFFLSASLSYPPPPK